MSIDDDSFERRTRGDLRRMVAEITPETRARLDEMAAKAARQPLAETPRRAWRSAPWSRLALPVGGSAVAVALALVMFKTPETPPLKSGAQADDLALLLDVDLDLLEQMEFYQWLDREPGLLDGSAANPAEAQRS